MNQALEGIGARVALRSSATEESRSPVKNFAPTIFCLSLSPVGFQIPGETIWPSLSVSTIEPISLGQGMDQLTQSWPLGTSQDCYA